MNKEINIYLSQFISTQLKKILIEKLKNKTNFFDYIKEDTFLTQLNNNQFVIYQSEYLLVLSEFKQYETGLKVASLTVISLKEVPDYHYEDMLSYIEHTSFSSGIDRIIMNGRLGWKKKFPDYHTSAITLYKDSECLN